MKVTSMGDINKRSQKRREEEETAMPQLTRFRRRVGKMFVPPKSWGGLSLAEMEGKAQELNERLDREESRL